MRIALGADDTARVVDAIAELLSAAGHPVTLYGKAAGEDDAWGATTIEPKACRLTFVVDDAPGAARILLYRRGEDVVRWRLAAASGS